MTKPRSAGGISKRVLRAKIRSAAWDNSLIARIMKNGAGSFDDLMPIFKGKLSKNEEDALRQRVVFRIAHRRYDAETWWASTSVLLAADRLHQCLALLRSYRRSVHGRLGITHSAWAEYHLAFFDVTAASICDTAIALVNQIMRLGYDRRHCKRDEILSNSHIKGTTVAKRLIDLESVLKTHRTRKNLYAHRGWTSDISELLGSDDWKWIELAESFADGFWPQLSDRRIDAAFRAEIQKVASNYAEVLEEAEPRIVTFMEALAPVYEHHAAALRRKA